MYENVNDRDKDELENKQTLENARISSGNSDSSFRSNSIGIGGPSIVEKMTGTPNRNKFKKMFFTRPMLNLNFYNITRSRVLAKLLTNNVNSIERFVHCALDPRQGYGEGNFMSHGIEDASDLAATDKTNKLSGLIDGSQPFLGVLTNYLKTASGWPDIVLDTYTSKPGMRKEVVGWTDSTNKIFTAWDMDMTFKNTIDEPIYLMMDIWVEYQSMISQGFIMPWYDFLLGRRIDYTIGIFVITLFEDNRTIQHIAKTIAHPLVNPKGKFYNIDTSANYAEEMNDINMRWRCYGAEYDDKVLFMDFNRYVASFNRELRGFLTGDISAVGEKYVELTPDLYPLFSDIAIPYIDIRYNKLEWLVARKDLKTYKKGT